MSPLDAALAAAAREDMGTGRALSVTGQGRVLVIGEASHALAAATDLTSGNSVTVVITDHKEDAADLGPGTADAVVAGKPVRLRGHFGAWALEVEGYEEALQADAILDLTREAALVPAPALRRGYERCDPRRPAALQDAVRAVADCRGDMSHPLYLAVQQDLCAHARSGIQGCTRCLDTCPPSALAPAGNHVVWDPYVCAGCGACAGACPTGALRYGQPAEEATQRRLRAALQAWRNATTQPPTLLLHDEGHGTEVIKATADFADDWSETVLPLPLGVISQVGAELFLMATAWGAGRIVCLCDPAHPETLGSLSVQATIVNAFTTALGFGECVVHVATNDPEELVSSIGSRTGFSEREAADFLPLGDRRSDALQAARHLHAQAPNAIDVVELPAGAPFGAVEVAPKACTLCLACVGACPTGALRDNPDRPYLGFQEDACVQCGLCRATCPEDAITLHPRLHPSAPVGEVRTLHEEAPFACISCGKAFGVRQTIERTLDRLAGHPMLVADPRLAQRVKMCADCRVIDQFRDPLATGANPRPRVRTTDDYKSGPGPLRRDPSTKSDPE